MVLVTHLLVTHNIVSFPGCIQENWPGNLCKFKPWGGGGGGEKTPATREKNNKKDKNENK